MKYTLKQFQIEYPNDNVCLEVIFKHKFNNLHVCPKCIKKTVFYKVNNRKCYACKWCAYQIYPLANTIFAKSTTPLTDWFYVIYLFSVSKNGVSAAEIQRHLGVTYKTAWRMAKQIRLLMEQDNNRLGNSGKPVEADELLFGGKYTPKNSMETLHHNKTVVFGAVERNGKAKVQIADWASTNRAMTFVRANLESGIDLYTDGAIIYKWADKEFKHSTVVHSRQQWKNGDAHTNTIEGIWSFIQSSIDGTYRGISPKYLQHYLDEFIFRYNHRDESIFGRLMEEAVKPF